MRLIKVNERSAKGNRLTREGRGKTISPDEREHVLDWIYSDAKEASESWNNILEEMVNRGNTLGQVEEMALFARDDEDELDLEDAISLVEGEYDFLKRSTHDAKDTLEKLDELLDDLKKARKDYGNSI